MPTKLKVLFVLIGLAVLVRLYVFSASGLVTFGDVILFLTPIAVARALFHGSEPVRKGLLAIGIIGVIAGIALSAVGVMAMMAAMTKFNGLQRHTVEDARAIAIVSNVAFAAELTVAQSALLIWCVLSKDVVAWMKSRRVARMDVPSENPQ
jgi:hypothetical protein